MSVERSIANKLRESRVSTLNESSFDVGGIAAAVNFHVLTQGLSALNNL